MSLPAFDLSGRRRRPAATGIVAGQQVVECVRHLVGLDVTARPPARPARHASASASRTGSAGGSRPERWAVAVASASIALAELAAEPSSSDGLEQAPNTSRKRTG